jgi:ribosomal protein S18 acetylase RimI-like enzyme
MVPPATVVAAAPADVALLHALTQRTWHGTVDADSSAFRETEDTLRALFAAGGGAFVLRIGGEPAGAVRWLPVPHASRSWEIKRLGVLREWRGHGFGERLAAAVETAARAAGVRRIQLGVRADQPRLVGFWSALGYRIDEQVVLSSRNPLTAPAVTMSRGLDADGTD